MDRLRGLFLQMPGQFLEHVFEHGVERVVKAVAKDAILLGLLHCRTDRRIQFGIHLFLLLVAPFAKRDKVP